MTNNTPYIPGDSEVFISTTPGILEGRFYNAGITKGYSSKKIDGVVLILPPNPKFSSTLNNKVVFQIYKTFKGLGFSTLRINYLGVGKSSSCNIDYSKTSKLTSEEVKEVLETNTEAVSGVIDWLRGMVNHETKIWIAGFSFGAWIAMQTVVRRPEILGFISVSPPAGRYDFSFFSPCPTPGLIINAECDEIIRQRNIIKMFKAIKSRGGAPVNIKTIFGANHCYTNHMSELEKIIINYVKQKYDKYDMDTLLGQGKGKNKVVS